MRRGGGAGPAVSRLLAVAVAAGVAGWLAGFVWFMNVTGRAAARPPAHTDGIVALTGGAGRVELALHLLADGQADRLLLSGIGGGSDLATLGRLAGVDTARLADRITLTTVALALVFAGALGNVHDRIAYGAVVDFIEVHIFAYHFPDFNVADSSVVTGACLLLLDSLRHKKTPAQ